MEYTLTDVTGTTFAVGQKIVELDESGDTGTVVPPPAGEDFHPEQVWVLWDGETWNGGYLYINEGKNYQIIGGSVTESKPSSTEPSAEPSAEPFTEADQQQLEKLMRKLHNHVNSHMQTAQALDKFLAEIGGQQLGSKIKQHHKKLLTLLTDYAKYANAPT